MRQSFITGSGSGGGRGSNSSSGSSSSSLLHLILALLIGLYAGINLSGVTKIPILDDHESSLLLRNKKQQPQQSQADRQLVEEDWKKKYQSEIQQWKNKATELEKEYASVLHQIHILEEDRESSWCSENNQKEEENDKKVPSEQNQDAASSSSYSNNNNNPHPHPFCQSLSHPTPSAMALWNQHLLKIFEATRVPTDRKWQFHDFTAQLLQIVTPRLPRSVKATPYDWRPVEHALTIAWNRYQYLQLSPQEKKVVQHPPPRPLKILIMGGSLLVGTNCRMLMKELNFQFRLPKRECTWSNRLGEFLNALFAASATTTTNNDNDDEKEPLVQVTKVAMGGTNTATGSIIWQYDLIQPPEARHPDIVINAYSTNDMHILTMLEAQSSNTTLRDRTFDMMQTFVRQVLSTKRCPDDDDNNNNSHNHNDDDFVEEPIPPLLLHMDDYLGNEQRRIWETTELSQGIDVLAFYYGFATMSFANVIRSIVYGDTYETWFSSEWWKQDAKTKSWTTFEREIHPGMGMHIASTWVTAYNLLHLASTFCSLPAANSSHTNNNNVYDYQPGWMGLPELKRTEKEPKGKPQPPPKGLPPVLTKELLLEDVTALWKHDANNELAETTCRRRRRSSSSSSSHSDQPPLVKCPFSWVSGLSLQQNNVTWVQEYFQRQSSVWQGWQLSVDDKDKIGFVPVSVKNNNNNNDNATRMVLDFHYSQQKQPQKIRSVTFFFMKSYGPKWSGSQLQVRIWQQQQSPSPPEASSSSSATTTTAPNQKLLVLLQERQLMGVHNKTTSEMYTEEIVLAEPVESMQLEATLVGGSTFKIMGLAVCS
jgi:hypothetical protein